MSEDVGLETQRSSARGIRITSDSAFDMMGRDCVVLTICMIKLMLIKLYFQFTNFATGNKIFWCYLIKVKGCWGQVFITNSCDTVVCGIINWLAHKCYYVYFVFYLYLIKDNG